MPPTHATGGALRRNPMAHIDHQCYRSSITSNGRRPAWSRRPPPRPCARRAPSPSLFGPFIGFTALILVSVVTGLFRQGDSLLYGDTITVPMQASADNLGQWPDGLHRRLARRQRHASRSDDVADASEVRAGPRPGGRDRLGALVAGRSPECGCARRPVRGRQRKADSPSGGLLVAGGFALNTLNYAVLNAFFNQVPEYPSVDLAAGPFTPLPAGMLVGGLLAFALAAVFADGARLREDVDGMV